MHSANGNEGGEAGALVVRDFALKVGPAILRVMSQEFRGSAAFSLSKDLRGSASTFRTLITTTAFFIIADRLSVAAVPCEIAGAMPVGDGKCFVVFRLLCVFGIIEPPPLKLALITYGVAN